MDIKKLSKDFFSGQAKENVCLARVQPHATKFQDTLFLEVSVDKNADEDFCGFVLSPLLILSNQVIIYL